MAANMYDQPVQYSFVDTYVPLNFGELYRIGQAQNQAVQQAADQFYGQLQKFGEFRSPSTVDTQNWYNLTIGSKPIQSLVQRVMQDPNALKDAAFRASLQAATNGVDYASLSLLKESADNLRRGLEMRAQMEAQGIYNRNWDDSNIPGYDTLGTGKVFSDITPIKWMSANELSNAYFDNLKPSSLGTISRNGVQYDVTGINYNTLLGISAARFNDLVNTPQGRMYYRDLLRANNGNQEAAKQAFIGMIADSQRDRLVNQLTVNPAWLAAAKSRSSSSGSTSTNPLLLRRDMWRINYQKQLSNKVNSRYHSLDDYKKEQMQRAAQGDKSAVTRVRLVEEAQASYERALQELPQLAAAYKANPGNEEIEARYFEAYNIVNGGAQSVTDQALVGGLARQIFEDIYGDKSYKVDPESPNYSGKKYAQATWETLRTLAGDSDIYNGDDGDRMLTVGSKASYGNITYNDGMTRGVYQYDDSTNFMTSEQVLEMLTGDPDRTIKRDRSLTSRMFNLTPEKFEFNQKLTSGAFKNVRFIPEGGYIQYQNQDLVLGKLLIPKEEVLGTLSRGIDWSVLIGSESTDTLMKEHFDAKSRTIKSGDDEIEMWEIPVAKNVPIGGQIDVGINVPYPNDLGAGTAASRAAYETQQYRIMQ